MSDEIIRYLKGISAGALTHTHTHMMKTLNGNLCLLQVKSKLCYKSAVLIYKLRHNISSFLDFKSTQEQSGEAKQLSQLNQVSKFGFKP